MTITYVFENKLYVNMTNRCPNHCEFCLRNNTDSVGDSGNLWLEKEPDKEEILADILKRDLSSFPQIVFCGYGEPTCRLDDMLWICKNIKDRSDIEIRVNTNGLSSLINNRDTAKEFSSLVDVLSISLNAPTPQKYDDLCHSDFGLNAYDCVINFAKEVKNYVPKVYLSIVNYKIDEDEIDKCKEICSDIGVSFRLREYIE